MAQKHTPGPWNWSHRFRTADDRETWTLLGAGGYGILSCDGEGNSPQGIGDASNAALISAAPDLLEMLIYARAELAGLPRSLGYDFTHLPKIDAAIAKATGESA